MAQLSPRRLAAALVAAFVSLSIPVAAQPGPLDVLARAAQAQRAPGVPPTLGITFNNAAQAPGRTLVAGVTVSNPGGGPLVDFYFLIVLPDGTTAVSTGPGVGARFGTLGNLRSLVPVARSISLAPAFPFQSTNFFSHTFTGTEPQGVYTVYFAAVAAGALNDGAIGAGDLVALASRTFSVGPSGAPETDASRAVAATIARTGGAVQTSTASGIGLRLAVPAGGLNTATPVTIAPLTAFNDLQGGTLLAGVRAEPSGLGFNTPATLTITLPPGFQATPFGLVGFVADTDGGNLQRVPVSLVGNVATMQVPHFSVAGVFAIQQDSLGDFCEDAATAEHRAACAQLIPLYRAELLRLQAQGGAISPAFRSAWASILGSWLRSGILPRLAAARSPVVDPDAVDDVASELHEWTGIYSQLFDIKDRTNGTVPSQPLGSLLDQAQDELLLTLSAAMDFLNGECLADKANVGDYVYDVDNLVKINWNFMFDEAPPPPFLVTYCARVDIQAAPLPAITVGTPTLMPLDIRLRFSDGTELPAGIPLAIAISATNATVSPAGGIIPTPVRANITVTPSAPVGTMTISAAVELRPYVGLNRLPVGIVTFPMGADLAFSGATLSAGIDVNDTFVNIGPDPPPVFSTVAGLPAQITASRSHVVNRGYPVGGYSASGTTSLTRTVTRPPGALVIGYTGTASASIGRVGAPVSEIAEVLIHHSDSYLANLPVPFDVVSPLCQGGMRVFHLTNGFNVTLTPGATVRLTAGTFQFQYSSGTSLQMDLRTGVTSGTPPGVSPVCSLEFRAAP